jgi:hypothetical protein
LKLLGIWRYGRIVYEFNGSRPGEYLSLRQFDVASGTLRDESLTTWLDNGVERPINSFYQVSVSVPGVYWYDIDVGGIDSQGNMYLYYCFVPNSGSSFEQRIAIFNHTRMSVGTPEPDPSATDAVFVSDNVVLKSTLPVMPSGYSVTGSRWEVYSGGNGTLTYSGDNTGSGNTHKVQSTLPEGDYRWRVAYDWRNVGSKETVRGSTKWSQEARITISDLPAPPPEPDPEKPEPEEPEPEEPEPTPTPRKSGGGCSTAGFGVSGVLLLLSAALLRIKRR